MIAKTEWISPLLDVDKGEALGLLSTLQWVKDLHLFNRDFEMVSKIVADSISTAEGMAPFQILGQLSMIRAACYLLI